MPPQTFEYPQTIKIHFTNLHVVLWLIEPWPTRRGNRESISCQWDNWIQISESFESDALMRSMCNVGFPDTSISSHIHLICVTLSHMVCLERCSKHGVYWVIYDLLVRQAGSNTGTRHQNCQNSSYSFWEKKKKQVRALPKVPLAAVFSNNICKIISYINRS